MRPWLFRAPFQAVPNQFKVGLCVLNTTPSEHSYRIATVAHVYPNSNSRKQKW